jgi:hypothetical protein
MKQSETPVKKELKKIKLKDLIPVDYTDDSWPEDEEGQLAYDYWKRASGVLDEEDTSLEEAYDTQISKYELNGELKRVNDRIKFLQNTPKKFSSSPLNVSSELKKLEDLRDSILAMLKEEDILEEVDSEYITEALNMLQRMKRRAIMRKNKSKILAGRRRSQRRRASTSVLQQRAMRAARSALARRLLHKSKGEASYGEKVRVEKMLAARQSTIKNIARRLLSTVRQKERQRFQTHATPPKPIQSVKPNK